MVETPPVGYSFVWMQSAVLHQLKSDGYIYVYDGNLFFKNTGITPPSSVQILPTDYADNPYRINTQEYWYAKAKYGIDSIRTWYPEAYFPVHSCETIRSSAVALKYDADKDGKISKIEANTALTDYLWGSLSKEDSILVLDAWIQNCSLLQPPSAFRIISIMADDVGGGEVLVTVITSGPGTGKIKVDGNVKTQFTQDASQTSYDVRLYVGAGGHTICADVV